MASSVVRLRALATTTLCRYSCSNGITCRSLVSTTSIAPSQQQQHQQGTIMGEEHKQSSVRGIAAGRTATIVGMSTQFIINHVAAVVVLNIFMDMRVDIVLFVALLM
jgi:hypothetical protein